MAGKLVLQVREKEYILIGSDIVVTLERLRGNRTSISIQAPSDVKVLRGTLVEREKNEQVQQVQRGDAKSVSMHDLSKTAIHRRNVYRLREKEQRSKMSGVLDRASTEAKRGQTQDRKMP